VLGGMHRNHRTCRRRPSAFGPARCPLARY
jgi:hypothetical protein